MIKVQFIPFEMADGPTIGPFLLVRFQAHSDIMDAEDEDGRVFRLELPKDRSRYCLCCEHVENTKENAITPPSGDRAA